MGPSRAGSPGSWAAREGREAGKICGRCAPPCLAWKWPRFPRSGEGRCPSSPQLPLPQPPLCGWGGGLGDWGPPDPHPCALGWVEGAEWGRCGEAASPGWTLKRPKAIRALPYSWWQVCHCCLGPHSWSGGDSQTPTFTLQEHRGARIPSAPSPPPIINFHQWPSGAGGGRGTRRFPLIAKINTLKFLQEAEECGTAGKNCFIICNNTKAGGGAGGSRERRGKAEAKGWPRRWGQPQLSTSTGTSSPKDVARGSRCRGGRSRAQPQLSELLPAAPCLSFPSDFYVAGGQSAAPAARRCRPLPTPLGGLQPHAWATSHEQAGGVTAPPAPQPHEGMLPLAVAAGT